MFVIRFEIKLWKGNTWEPQIRIDGINNEQLTERRWYLTLHCPALKAFKIDRISRFSKDWNERYANGYASILLFKDSSLLICMHSCICTRLKDELWSRILRVTKCLLLITSIFCEKRNFENLFLWKISRRKNLGSKCLPRLSGTGRHMKTLKSRILFKIFSFILFFLNNFLLKKWANPGLFFVYFRSFQTNIFIIFTTD